MAVRTLARDGLWWGLREGFSSRLRSLAYVQAGKRDLRLDFLRGLAVSVMVIDHMGGDSILTQLSGANRFIVSAAEGFVFLSGLVLGMVYGDRILRSGAGEAVRGMLQRAATLYKASAGVALSFLALFVMTNIRLWVDRAGGFGTDDPMTAVVGILTLHHSYHGSDVLVMYTMMLAIAPAVIYLLYRRRTWLVLLASVSLWALYQRYPQETVVPWNVVNSSFPVAAWQLLFVLGMVAGFHRVRLIGWLLSGTHFSRLVVLTAVSTVYLLGWSFEAHASLALPQAWFGDATYGSLFAKVTLAPGRVVAFLALAVLAFTLVNALWLPLRTAFGWFLLPLGQNSLYVYVMQLFVLVLAYNLAPVLVSWYSVEAVTLASQVFGLGLLWIMVRARFLFGIVPR